MKATMSNTPVKKQEPKIDKITLEMALASIKKTKELIYYSVQFSNAVRKEMIKPDHFENKLFVPEPHADNGFYIDLDWSTDSKKFKETAEDVFIHAASYAIIMCRETYPKDIWVTEESQNQGLYAAQTILKLVRHAMAHIKTGANEFAAPYWDIKSKDCKILK